MITLAPNSFEITGFMGKSKESCPGVRIHFPGMHPAISYVMCPETALHFAAQITKAATASLLTHEIIHAVAFQYELPTEAIERLCAEAGEKVMKS